MFLVPWPLFRSRQERRYLLDRPLRRREADARGPRFDDVVEAGEGEGEVAAALVAGEGVDLVDDDGAHAAQGLAAARRREHEVERLRRRDENVGRRADEGLAVLRRRVASADGGADGEVEALAGGDLRYLGQRRLQVALDVVAQRLQR